MGENPRVYSALWTFFKREVRPKELKNIHKNWKKDRRCLMKVNKIDHICIAVKDLDAARKIWEPILGKGPDDPYVDEPEKIRVARYWLGEVGFELMESTTPDGDVAKFIEKRGEGVMIIGLNVDSTEAAMNELKAKNYPFIGGLRPFRGCKFAFVHPKMVNGVLLELIDYPWNEFKKK
jgi:methylmalonyl-CoA/ethylmalonyl-CoA epimerase